MKTHLRFLWCCLALLCVAITSRAQLTGTINVPSTLYPTLDSVIKALNAVGVGAGGATINLTANQTAPINGDGYRLGSATLNATTSATNRLIFNGNGNTLTASPGVGTTDALFSIMGTDWVTINALHLAEAAANTTNTTRIEWGYNLVKLSSTAPYDGCQNDIINGCTITLDKTYSTTVGIRMWNSVVASTSTLSTTGATVASTNSYNTFRGNNISGVTRGIATMGFTTNTYYDKGNVFGGPAIANGNTISIGGSTNTSYGIYPQYDSVITIQNNNITIASGHGNAGVYGIYMGTGQGDMYILSNTIDLSSNGITSSSVYGFYNGGSHCDPTSSPSGMLSLHRISGNTVRGTNNSTSPGYFYGIYEYYAYCKTLQLTSNSVRDVNWNAYSLYGYYTYYSGTPNIQIDTNVVYNMTDRYSTGYVYPYYHYHANGTTGTLSFQGNMMRKVSSVYGLYPTYLMGSTTQGIAQKMLVRYNTFDSVDESARTGTLYMYMYVYYGSDSSEISYNQIKDFNGPTNYYAYLYFYGYYGPNLYTVKNNQFRNISGGNLYLYNYLGYYCTRVDSNLIYNISSRTGGSNQNLIGYYGNNVVANGNTVRNINMAGSSSIYNMMGYYSTTFTGTGNTIDSLSSQSGTIYATYSYSNGGALTFNKHRVSRIYTNSTGGTMYGMWLGTSSGGMPVTIYNSEITDFEFPTGYSNSSSAGIYLGGTDPYRLYNNTIRIKPANQGGFTGVYYTTSGSLDLRNNIINVDATPATGGFTTALRRSSGSTTPPANFLASSNGNIYYAPNVTSSWLYGEGSSAAGMVNTYSLANDPNFNTPCGKFKTFMAHNFGSFTENNLVPSTTPNTYKPSNSGTSFAEKGSVPTPFAIPQDYDGVARGPIADIGALEFAGTALDQAPPVISYTTIPTQSYCVTTPQLIVTITDVTGVDTTAGNKPRLYYKKANNNSNDADVFGVANSSAGNGWKWVEPTSISGNTYVFDFDYSKLRSAVVSGDTIKYFVIAQDLAAAKNTGFNIANFSVCPSSVNLGASNGPLVTPPEANGFRILNTPTFAAVGYPPAACLSGSTTVSVSPTPLGTAVQWQSATLTGAFSNITGATNYSYTTPTLTTSMRYRALIYCGTNVLATSTIDTFVVANPSITSVTGATRCGFGPVTLSAAGSTFTTPKWYTSATGGTGIFSGNTFVTPNIGSTTTYYVSGNTPNAGMESVGLAYQNYTSYSSQGGLEFVFRNSVTNFYSTTVYPSYANNGQFMVELWDDYLSPTTVFYSAGPFSVNGGTGNTPVTLPLNFLNIKPGKYWLVMVPVSGTPSLNMYYNGGAGYPITSPSGGTSITNSYYSTYTGYYTYFYNNIVGADCESATRVPVTATVIPAPPITVSSPQVPGICVGATANLNVTSANPYYIFTWQPGNLTGTTFTVSPTTTTTYRVTATDPYTGCVAIDSIKLNVNAQPQPPVITPNPATICSGQSVRLLGQAPPGMAGVGTLVHPTSPSTQANQASSTSSPIYSIYTRNQTHYLITKTDLNAMGIIGPNLLTSWAFNVASTGFMSNNFTIKIAHAGSITALTSVNCNNYPGAFQQVYFQASYTATSGWNTFNFTTPFAWDGTSNIVIAASHDNDPVNCGSNWSSAPQVNMFSNFPSGRSIQVYSDGPGCTVTSCAPSGTFYGNSPSTYMPGMRIGFTAPASINWLNVTGLYKNSGLTTAVTVTDTTTQPYAAPPVTTVYRAITNLQGCKSLPSQPDTVYVVPSPVVTVTPAGPQTICAGQTVTLCVPTAVNQTYQWYLNNTAISGGTSNCYTATAAGTYKVTVTNLITGCQNTSVDIPVVVNPAPAVTVTLKGATTVCNGVTDTLTATAGFVTYQWKESGVNIAGATSPSLIVTTSGSYTVEVTNANGCVGTSAATVINVNVTPTTITPMGPTTFCAGNTVTLQGPTPPTGVTYTYQWKQNNVNIAGSTGSSYTASTTGSYTVVVTNTTTGCKDSSSATVVNVGPPPSSVITPNGTVGLCQGGSVTLNAVSQTGLCYQWSNNGTPIAGATNASYTATTSGSYTVAVTICSTPACNSSTSTPAVVNINPLPTATATAAGSASFCQGGSVVINANTGTGLSYQWNLNGNPISGQTAASITAAAAGNYTVTVTNTATGCTNVSNAVAVTVNALPATAVTSATPTTFCAGGNVNLCVPTGANAYQWRLNGNPIASATTACYTATATGLYSVTVTGTNSCVATSAPTSVQVNALPNVTTIPTGAAPVCQGYSINLTVGADTNYTYQWLLNNVNISGATSAVYPTGSAGTYKVRVTNKVTGCVATSNDIIVTVTTPPSASALLLGPSTICQGDSARITANTGTGYMYQWRLNGVNIPNETNNVFYAKQSGSYTVNVSSATGCFNISNPVIITVNPRPASFITYNTPLEFCEGSAVVLTANTGTGLTYQWLMNGTPNGNTGVYNESKTSGKYALRVTNSFGCSNTSDTLDIVVHPAPVPTLVRNGSTLETATPYVSYQWFYNNDPVGGATNQSYTFTENGAYKVRVIDIYGCEGTSNLYFVNNVGIPTSGVGKAIRVFPNPTTGIVNIDASVKVKVVLRDVAGKSVLEASDVKQINLGDIANGMYLLYISDMNGTLLRADKITKTAN